MYIPNSLKGRRVSALPPPSRFFIFLYAIIGILFYLIICFSVENGRGFLAWLMTVMLSIVCSVAVGSIVQKRSPWQILNPRKQSWAYMFGDPLCLATILWVAADAWGKGLVPQFARETWWQVAMTAIGVAAGLVMSAVDRRRYARNGALAAYGMMDKIFHDKVVVLVLFPTLLVCAPPLLWVWDAHAVTMLVLLAAYAGLLVIDERRNVDPVWQYNLS